MQRIATTTAETDLHGTGRDGFRYGDPGVPTAPTEVSDDWLNAVQEELANVAELDGKTLDSADNFQVADTVLGTLRDVLSSSRGWAASGLVATDISGLDIAISDGVFYANGRRYTVTDVPNMALADNDVRYISIEPDPADERGFIVVDSASLSTAGDSALVAIVTTNGGAIDNIENWTEANGTGTRWEASQMIAQALLPNGSSATLGLSAPFLGHTATGRWSNGYLQELTIGPDSGGTGDNTRTEATEEIVLQTVSGAGTDSHILIATGGYDDGDHVTIELLVSGRRTDVSGFGYSAHMTIGAQFDSGAWTFDGAVSVLQEEGDGGGVRDLRPIIDGSDRVTLLMDIDNAEDWTFVTKVTTVWNTGA